MGGKKKQVKEKPLDKMTAKELREIAQDIPEIVGVHGMNKAELVGAVKEARGIVDGPGSSKKSDVREIKKRIKELKVKRQNALETENDKMADIYRQRIIRLKKKSRRYA